MDRRKAKTLTIAKWTFKRLIRPVLLAAVCVAVLTCSCADKMIFQLPEASYSDADGVIMIPTADGGQIAAMYYNNPAAEFTILFSHGNAEDIGQNRSFFEMLQRRGYSVLAYDYRGYGVSNGTPSEEKFYLDIEAAYRYLTDTLNVRPDRIIARGRSIGTGPSVYLAADKPVAGLILESPFLSAFRVVTGVELLPFDKFKNVNRIDKIDCPVLIIHGSDDRVVPFEHGKKLYEKANRPKQFLRIEGAGHNNLLGVAGEHYWRALEKLTHLARQHKSQ